MYRKSQKADTTQLHLERKIRNQAKSTDSLFLSIHHSTLVGLRHCNIFSDCSNRRNSSRNSKKHHFYWIVPKHCNDTPRDSFCIPFTRTTEKASNSAIKRNESHATACEDVFPIPQINQTQFALKE